ncbi:uncharacterized protein LOC132701226 [Cylas formicarius]|uniref:uncharacterized protein LOC132701226 n=1 Tax=Cylas formicarius TaxID=197179 RepID=UPI002958B768|nr:uncharacterized protein LOC132701226 [Cylas formicarius]XP_060524995.1 uncharacterized protein LOC132701226 [Cylas formicarius]XP_060525002.1 uncharacterized protein LOC132701226 [Cylas formicarius]
MDSEVIQQTWHGLESKMRNVGLKEGLFDGRASNFQVGFDSGYKIGLKNGFLLGQYVFNNSKMGESPSNHRSANGEVSEDPKRELCVICSGDTENLNFSEIKMKQDKLIKARLKSNQNNAELN